MLKLIVESLLSKLNNELHNIDVRYIRNDQVSDDITFLNAIKISLINRQIKPQKVANACGLFQVAITFRFIISLPDTNDCLNIVDNVIAILMSGKPDSDMVYDFEDKPIGIDRNGQYAHEIIVMMIIHATQSVTLQLLKESPNV